MLAEKKIFGFMGLKFKKWGNMLNEQRILAWRSKPANYFIWKLKLIVYGYDFVYQATLNALLRMSMG